MATLKARNFPGGAGTDILSSASVVTYAQLTTWYARFNIAAIDATSRRLVIIQNVGDITFDTTNGIEFSSLLNVWTTSGVWKCANPSTGAEHDIVVTYDAA